MPEEIAWVIAQRHRPLAVGQALSSVLQAVDADSIVKSRIDRLISTYTYEFGGCNRIYNTAIPSAYTRCVGGLLRHKRKQGLGTLKTAGAHTRISVPGVGCLTKSLPLLLSLLQAHVALPAVLHPLSAAAAVAPG
jgi:hypothetical protein